MNLLRKILKTDEQILWAQKKYNISDPKDLTIEQASEIIKLYKEKRENRSLGNGKKGVKNGNYKERVTRPLC